MQQIKIFKSIESELWTMQDEINDWIKADSPKIINITGNIAPQTSAGAAMGGSFSASDVLVIVLYEKE